MSKPSYTNTDFNSLWSKKYAPTCIADMVLSEENREIISNFLKNNDIPSLLFSGQPGQGKTTLAVLLCEELGADVLKVNASKENGIDTIRGQVETFASVLPAEGERKVVILDEADRLSTQAQDALRGMMEDYARQTRFILTANEQGRISKAIQSRCIALNLTPPKDEYNAHIVRILQAEGIKIEPDQYEPLKRVLDASYPDIRIAIGVAQRSSLTGTLKINEAVYSQRFFTQLITRLFDTDEIDIREVWLKNEHDFQSDYQRLMLNLIDYVYKNPVIDEHELSQNVRGNIILALANGLRDSAHVLDQEVNFYSVILTIKKLLK